MKHPRYIFGPVDSRRYGRSLGLDLVKAKTCPLSCRFCQLGDTPPQGHTAERSQFPPAAEIIRELEEWLGENPPPDYITAGGSGEPTLNAGLGEILGYIASRTRCKSLLLSNGALFDRPEIRGAAALADTVKVTLCAWDDASYRRIARPAEGVAPFEKIIEGFRAFRGSFGGRLDCEVFLVPGFNDSEEICARMARAADSFSPDSITLNTAVRPGADPSVRALPPERMEALRALFGPRAGNAGAEREIARIGPDAEAAGALVRRHPVSLAALSKATGLDGEALAALVAAAGAIILDTPSGPFAANAGCAATRGATKS